METQETVETVSPVVTEAPKSFREHYAAAKAAAAEEPKTDDTPAVEEQPSQDPETPADETPEAGHEEDTLLTQEEVEKLSPKEKNLYAKAQKAFTQKTQALAEQRKQFEQWKPLVDAFERDPDAVIRELAQRRGLRFAEEAVEQDTTPATPAIPKELEFLGPILQPLIQNAVDAAKAEVRAEMAPVKEGMDKITGEAIAAETAATIKAFEADPRFKDWKKHEPKMLEIAQKFMPNPENPMNDREYMEHLYTLATAGISEAERTKKVIAKIDKSVQSSEPTSPSVPSGLVEHAIPPRGKRGIREAYAAAKRGELWADSNS